MKMIREIEISDLLESSSNRPGYPYLFRGENKKYKYRTPAIYRNHKDNDDGKFWEVHKIGMQIYDDLVVPKLRHHFGFSFHNKDVIGNPLIVGFIPPGATRFYLQIVSLLQHYGLPTQFIDVTFDPYIALFFACYSENEKSFIEDGYGYIYKYDTFSLYKTERNDFIGIDLSESAKFFSKEKISHLTRPFMQKAATLCLGSWLFPLDLNRLDHHLDLLSANSVEWAVDRSKIDFSMFNGFDPYPNEPLLHIINPYINKC